MEGSKDVKFETNIFSIAENELSNDLPLKPTSNVIEFTLNDQSDLLSAANQTKLSSAKKVFLGQDLASIFRYLIRPLLFAQDLSIEGRPQM